MKSEQQEITMAGETKITRVGLGNRPVGYRPPLEVVGGANVWATNDTSPGFRQGTIVRAPLEHDDWRIERSVAIPRDWRKPMCGGCPHIRHEGPCWTTCKCAVR